jgi:hypothetical protein
VGTKLGALIAAALVFLARTAEGAKLRVDCARLGPAETEELSARARLTLDANLPEQAPELVEVLCDPERAWIRWVGPPVEELGIDERAGLVEGALDALDRRAHRVPQTQRPEQKGPEPSVVEPPSGAPRSRPRPRRGWAGGVGAAVSVDPMPVALGPELTLGIGASGLSGVASQALRAGLESNTLIFEVRVGLAWGAPYAPGRWWGVLLLGGTEGLAYVGHRRDTNAKSSATTPTLGLGLRAATGLGRCSIWVGLDGAWRVRPLELGAPYDLSLPRLHALLTLGVLWLAEPSSTDRAEPAKQQE